MADRESRVALGPEDDGSVESRLSGSTATSGALVLAMWTPDGIPREGHSLTLLKRKLRLVTANVSELVPMWSNNNASSPARQVNRRSRAFSRVEHLRELHVQWCSGGGDQSWFFAHGRAYRCGRGDCGQLGDKRTQAMALPTLLNRTWKPKITVEEANAVNKFKDAKAQLYRSADAISEQGRITLQDVNPLRKIAKRAVRAYDVIKTRRATLENRRIKVKSIGVGLRHTIIVTSIGDCWTFGDGNRQQLGIESRRMQEEPQLLPVPKTMSESYSIKSASAGSFHSALVSQCGRVFTFGQNQYGQLGHRNFEAVVKPKLVDALRKHEIIFAVCGGNHTIFLNDGNDCFSCGRGHLRGNGNPLGLGHTENEATPTLIAALSSEHVVGVAAGDRHTIFLTDTGHAWACGDNEWGQLGIDARPMQTKDGYVPQSRPSSVAYFDSRRKASPMTPGQKMRPSRVGTAKKVFSQGQILPELVHTVDDLVVVAAGNFHSMFLQSNGELWSCGKSRDGRLGFIVPDQEDRVYLPRRVDSILSTAKMFDARTDCSKYLSLVPPLIESRQQKLIKKMTPFWRVKKIIAPQNAPQKKIFDAFRILSKNLKKLAIMDRKMGIQRLFQEYDEDDSGELNPNEVILAIKDLSDQVITREKANEIIEQYDVNDNGTISEEEFIDYILDTDPQQNLLVVNLANRLRQLARKFKDAFAAKDDFNVKRRAPTRVPKSAEKRFRQMLTATLKDNKVSLQKITRGMLFGQLELIGKGIFTMEGTQVAQAHTMALQNALVHAPIVKTVDFHRNQRVPYESMFDLLDITDFQVSGLRMDYFDRGDSWEGGLFKNCWLCDEPLLFLSVFDETELCEECEEINIRPVHTLTEVIWHPTNLPDMVVERALEDMVRGFRRIARIRFERCPDDLLTRADFEEMLHDYYAQYRETFFGDHIAKEYHKRNSEADAAARARSTKKQMLQGRHIDAGDADSSSEETDSSDEEEDDAKDNDDNSEAGGAGSDSSAAAVEDRFAYRRGKRPSVPDGLPFDPVEMHPDGPCEVEFVLDAEWRKVGLEPESISLMNTTELRNRLDERFENEILPAFRKKDNRLFEVLLLERYGIFFEKYSREIIDNLSKWFQADVLKPDESWEAMRTACKADAQSHLEEVLGEWNLPPKVARKATRQLFDNINWCIDHYKDLTSCARVTSIACGGAHSLAITESGHVWTCGFFSYGQLGQGSMFQALERIENETSIPFFTTELTRPDRDLPVTGQSRENLVPHGRVRVKRREKDELLPWQRKSAEVNDKGLADQVDADEQDKGSHEKSHDRGPNEWETVPVESSSDDEFDTEVLGNGGSARVGLKQKTAASSIPKGPVRIMIESGKVVEEPEPVDSETSESEYDSDNEADDGSGDDEDSMFASGEECGEDGSNVLDTGLDKAELKAQKHARETKRTAARLRARAAEQRLVEDVSGTGGAISEEEDDVEIGAPMPHSSNRPMNDGLLVLPDKDERVDTKQKASIEDPDSSSAADRSQGRDNSAYDESSTPEGQGTNKDNIPAAYPSTVPESKLDDSTPAGGRDQPGLPGAESDANSTTTGNGLPGGKSDVETESVARTNTPSGPMATDSKEDAAGQRADGPAGDDDMVLEDVDDGDSARTDAGEPMDFPELPSTSQQGQNSSTPRATARDTGESQRDGEGPHGNESRREGNNGGGTKSPEGDADDKASPSSDVANPSHEDDSRTAGELPVAKGGDDASEVEVDGAQVDTPKVQDQGLVDKPQVQDQAVTEVGQETNGGIVEEVESTDEEEQIKSMEELKQAKRSELRAAAVKAAQQQREKELASMSAKDAAKDLARRRKLAQRKYKAVITKVRNAPLPMCRRSNCYLHFVEPSPDYLLSLGSGCE